MFWEIQWEYYIRDTYKYLRTTDRVIDFARTKRNGNLSFIIKTTNVDQQHLSYVFFYFSDPSECVCKRSFFFIS